MHIKPYLGEDIGRGKSGFADCGESGICWFTICILSPDDKKNLEFMLPICKEILEEWNLFVNESKTEFTYYLSGREERS